MVVAMAIFCITSVMIYHRRASLSEQNTDLLIYHYTKQDLSCTSTHLGITKVNSQDSYCQCAYIRMN